MAAMLILHGTAVESALVVGAVGAHFSASVQVISLPVDGRGQCKGRVFMSNLVYDDEFLCAGDVGGGLLRRVAGGYRVWWIDLLDAARASRQDHRLMQGVSDLDIAQLRDIGLERDAC